MRPSSRLRRLLGTILVTAVAAGGIDVAGAGAASAAGLAPDAVNGVFAGPCAAAGVQDFSAWRGTQATVAMDALDWRSWKALTDASWMGHCWAGTGIALTLAVPMFPTTGATLAAGAAGDYDRHFTDLATSLVANGLSRSTLRLGWEFNGNWQPWAAAGHEADFVSYYRRIVAAMRAVPGAAFSFNWNVAVGYTAIDAATAYPGDDVVDSIGINVYDQSWLPDTFPYPAGASADVRRADQANAWAGTVGGAFGMDHWAAFAASHRKPISVPEWGIVSSDAPSAGGDDPLFIAAMHTWIQVHKPLFALYFNSEGSLGDHRLTGGSVPAAAAAYQALFGDGPAPATLAADVEAATLGAAGPRIDSSAPTSTVLALVGGIAGATPVVGTSEDDAIGCRAPRIATTTTTTTTKVNGRVVGRKVVRHTAKATGQGVRRRVTKIKRIRQGSVRMQITVTSRLASCQPASVSRITKGRTTATVVTSRPHRPVASRSS